ncbi:hypothetical protein VTK56DRAFT_6297 [Thermocarpiscus australiensis]
MELSSGSTITLEGHEAPVRTVRFVDVPSANAPIIASGSWDKTLRYWDLRQARAIGSIPLGERVYAMDAAGPLLVAATADNQVHLVQLHGDPLQIWKSVKSPLSNQTRSLAVCAGGSRWAIGGIDGRAAAHAADDKEASINLTFKCHREQSPTKKTQTDVYAVNAVAFSPTQRDVLATAGGDGTLSIWDIRNRHRLLALPKAGGSLTALAFNRDASALAYAVGYDWARGYAGNEANYPRRVMLHPTEGKLKK